MSERYNAFNTWKPLAYREKCEAILRGEFEPPITLHIYSTNKCQLDCEWCIMREEKADGEHLSEEVFKGLIASANAMGIRSIHMSGGGEPTLYPHMPHLEKFNGLKVLSTNGEKLERFHVDLFDRIRISVDSATPETFMRKTGTSIDNARERFLWLYTRIQRLIEYRDESAVGTEIGLGFVLDHDNWFEVFKFCEMAEDLGVDFIHIRPAYYPKDSVENEEVQKIIVPAFHLCEAAKYATDIPIFAISEKFEGFWTDRQYSKCLASPLHAVITASGKLSVCQDVFIKFGNLYEQTLEEIWNSKEHHDAISKICLDECPRCIMNRANELMEHAFVRDELLLDLL